MNTSFRFCSVCGTFALMGLFTACAGPQTFSSSDQAADALVSALREGDQARLDHVLGTESQNFLSSGDPVADRRQIEQFLKAYDEEHRFEPGSKDSMILDVGKTAWPMPIPIAKDPVTHRWYFDVKNGEAELLNRRIGQNELYTSQVCLAIVDAQREYAAMDPEHQSGGKHIYAGQFISNPGMKNGLYWPTKEGEPSSPLGPLAESAASQGYVYTAGRPAPFHGYYYRMLTSQGPDAPGGAEDYRDNGKLTRGFAVMAYPATYGNSGIMTFMVNQNGILYCRDLGPNTPSIASTMASYDPGPDWSPVLDVKTVVAAP
jgi:hypothetical protein